MLAWLSPSQTYFQLQTACLLPQIPPRRTESSEGCRNRRRGVRGDNVWTGTHRQQLQKGCVSDPPDAATVVHELAHPVVLFPRLLAFLLFRLVPHFCPRWVSAAACHCVCVCIRRCVCVCVCVCVGLMMQQAVVQPWQRKSLVWILLSKATSALVNI